MHRKSLLTLLDAYQGHDAHEEAMRQRMRRFVERHPDCFQRELSVGHVTGSAWIVNQARDKALMLHHRKLDRWLQPGGHADGQTDVLAVALREAHEETGLRGIRPLSRAIFDVDIHTIPARGDEPEHEHFDVRFLLLADEDEPLRISRESKQLAWVTMTEMERLADERSILRMREKSRRP